MTPPQEFRDRLPDLLEERAAQRAPDELLHRFEQRMEDAPQRPGWATSERWFPMTTRVHLDQVRRIAVMVGALLLLALTLAASFAIGSRLLTNPATIIVSADGSGDVTTIGEGVEMAGDGDTILIRPGTYVEAVTVTKDLEIRGEGAVDSIIIRAVDDGPSIKTGTLEGRPALDQRYAVLIVEADATLSGVTFSGEPSAVVALGGAPTIAGNHFEGVGLEQSYEGDGGSNAIVVGRGSRAMIYDNRVVDSGAIATFDLSNPLIVGNELSGGAHIVGGFGDGAEIRDNRLEWANWGIESRGDTAPLIEGNIIAHVGLPIRAELGAAIIRGNHVEHDGSNETGIEYVDGSGAIEGNTISHYTRGVAVSSFHGTISGNSIDAGFEGVILTDSGGAVSDNQIKAVFAGITIVDSSPVVTDNAIEASLNGVSVVGEESAPTFSGNELCGTNAAVTVSDGATEPDLAGLEACTEN